MAKGNYEQQKRTYLRIAEGEFREDYNVDQNTPGAKQVTIVNPKTGESKTKWVLSYDFIEGYLTKVSVEKNDDFNVDVLSFHLYDPDTDETDVVDLNFNSGYGRDFIKRLKKADLTKPIKLSPYQIPRDDDKTKFNSGIGVSQPEGLNYVKIKGTFTKDDPNGAPSMADAENDFDIWKVKFGKFLRNVVNEDLAKNIPEKPWEVGGTKPVAETTKEMPVDLPDDDEDDLPF